MNERVSASERRRMSESGASVVEASEDEGLLGVLEK
jgi:hypothetical protein